jgi:hypothetical protein
MRIAKPWIMAILMLLAVTGFSCSRRPAADLKAFQQEGISLVYNANDWGHCTVQKQPRLTSQENGEGVPVDVFPTRISLAFQDKRPLPSLTHGPRYLFPVATVITVTPLSDTTVAEFNQAYPQLTRQAQQLEQLLQARPSLPRERKDMPDVFTVDCERELIAKPQFVDFHGGSGLLFITQYAQDFHSINNEELACVFQGLTTDRRYFIDARFALGHPTLDRSLDAGKAVPVERQARYLGHIQEELDHFPESSFNPPITDIKAVIASLKVSENK